MFNIQLIENNNIKEIEINNELKTRLKKLQQLRKQGIAFPNDFRRDSISDQLHAKYGNINKDKLDSMNIEVKIAGRLMSFRIMGKISFATLQDVGGKIQLYITNNHFQKKLYHENLKKMDIGDILGVCGKLFKTYTGELSVYCRDIRLLTKAIRPLPEKFHGLSNQEIRYRQRYLDLIVNEKSRKIFKIRSKIIEEIRKFMVDLNFMEVETPMMQTIPGGATACPFITHHNALNIDMYLRIAPELYLKRLVIGGFERVFEINRNFRNEGLSPKHNPEFTMMELYMAYADYNDLIILVQNLFKYITEKIFNNTVVKFGDQYFDFGKPFNKMTIKEAICNFNSEIKSKDLEDIVTITNIAQSLCIKITEGWSIGRIQMEIFKLTVENYLIQPTFITTYPTDVSPLARCKDENPFFTDRFELFIGGREIVNGFSELNDAQEQATRFSQQKIESKNSKNDIIYYYDEDYITALEHGLPPTAGLGIGIDRLIMLLTNSQSIKEVILFPIMRPHK